MRTVLACVAAVAALTAPPAAAGTPLWVPTVPGIDVSDVDSSADGTVVSVTGGTTLVSRDAGVTWTPLLGNAPDGGASHSSVAVANASRWYVADGDAVSLTTDGGTTWRPLAVPRVVKPPALPHEWATTVATSEGGRSVLVGWDGAHVRGVCPWFFKFTPLFSSVDGGARWRRTDFPGHGFVKSASWYDDRRAAVVVVDMSWSPPEPQDDGSCLSESVSYGSSLWTTTDGGATWRRARHSRGEHWSSAAWTSPTTLVVVAANNGEGLSYVSHDSGRTFSKPLRVWARSTAPGMYYALSDVEFVGKRGWVGVLGAGIYRTDNGGSEWTHEISPAEATTCCLPFITAIDRDRAVLGGLRGLLTRLGEAGPVAPAPSAPFIGPVAVRTHAGGLATTVYERSGRIVTTVRIAPGA